MDENVQALTEQTDVVNDVTTDVTEESSGKGKLIFFAILGMVVAAPITAIVFAVLWIKRGKKNKELQKQLDELSAKPAPAPAANEPKADEPKTEETPKEETK